MKTYFKRAALVSFAGLTIAASGASLAQGKPLEMVVGLAPGGAGDVSARLVAQHLEKLMGRTIVVLNKPGAGQVIAAGYLAKTAPEALTIGYMTNAIITSEMSGLSRGAYQVKDLTPACQVNGSGSVLVVRSDLPARTYEEFEQYAKKNSLTAGHQGNGSANHFRLSMLSKYRSVPMTMVPYRGEADVMNNLLGKHIDVAAVSPTTALRNLASGQIRVLMAWEDELTPGYGAKVPRLKDVDARIPDVGVKTYLWVRANAPKDQISKLQSACDALVKDEAFKQAFTKAGFDVIYRSGKDAAEDIKVDIKHYEQILKDVDTSK